MVFVEIPPVAFAIPWRTEVSQKLTVILHTTYTECSSNSSLHLIWLKILSCRIISSHYVVVVAGRAPLSLQFSKGAVSHYILPELVCKNLSPQSLILPRTLQRIHYQRLQMIVINDPRQQICPIPSKVIPHLSHEEEEGPGFWWLFHETDEVIRCCRQVRWVLTVWWGGGRRHPEAFKLLLSIFPNFT